jgi:hypothetical protein
MPAVSGSYLQDWIQGNCGQIIQWMLKNAVSFALGEELLRLRKSLPSRS